MRLLTRTISVLYLLTISGTASGTTLVALGTEELATQAEVVVRARVLGTDSKSTSDPDVIVTEIQVSAIEFLKGSGPAVLTISQEGGALEGRAYHIHGEASFEPGEEIVVFLRKRMGSGYAVVGLGQGKLLLAYRAGEEWVDLPLLVGIRFVHAQTGVATLAPRVSMTLRALREQILRAQAAGAPRP